MGVRANTIVAKHGGLRTGLWKKLLILKISFWKLKYFKRFVKEIEDFFWNIQENF
jgi:hypothetical protein